MTTTISTPTPATHDRAVSRNVWRAAGGLALAHVVLMFAGFSQEVAVEHGTAADSVLRSYGGANLTRVMAGGYVESMSFLVLLPAVVLVAWCFGRTTPAGRVAAQSFLALGVVYIASTLAVGMPPEAAALYAAQHGADGPTVVGINDIRNYSFYLQVATSCAMALALGIAALAERVFVRWVGWLGCALGLVGVVATPFAHNPLSLAFVIWWVGLAVLCLRGGPSPDRRTS
jgi:hypothetical protein